MAQAGLVKLRLARLMVVVGIAACLVALPGSSQASVQGGLFSTSVSKQVDRSSDGAYANLTVACPAGWTPTWGGYTDSLGDDIRRIAENVGFGSGASYSVDIVDYSSGVYAQTTVTATVLCVAMSNFTDSKAVLGTFPIQADHTSLGIVSCGGGWSGLSASVSFVGLDTTVLTSSPFNGGLGSWIVRGWNLNLNASMSVVVHCVPSANLDYVRVFTHSDAVGWGATASAVCPDGFWMMGGGTYHNGGDGGAITIDPVRDYRTLSSRTLSLSTGTMVTTIICVPGPVPIVGVTGNAVPLNSTTAQWQFTATDPAASGGYGMTTSCRLQVGNSDGAVIFDHVCTSPVPATDLAEGPYLMTVTATTSDNRVGYNSWPVTIDHTVPLVDFADNPGVQHPINAVEVQAQVSDALSYVVSLTCALDDATPAPCGVGVPTYSATDPVCNTSCHDYRGAQQFALKDLADGTHTLHVRATDSRSNTKTYNLPFAVDTVAPTVKQTGPTSPFTVGSQTTVTWTGSDAVSGINQYGVRWRKAPYNTGFGAWSTPVHTAPTVKSRDFGSLQRGTTYCFSVDASDHAGNVSPWTGGRCTSIPLDDRDLADSAAWTEVSAAGYFRGTALTTTRFGATLAVTGATVKRIAVVAKKCPTCGSVGVYVGGTLLTKVDLKAATTSRKVIVLPPFALTTGTVKLKVLSSGKLVQIDALGLSSV